MKPKSYLKGILVMLLAHSAGAAYAQPDTCPNYRDQWQWNDPVDPNVHCLPLVGIVSEDTGVGHGSNYGMFIQPLGDINNDGLNDWAVSHRLPDISYNLNELLVYRGVRNRLPKRGDGYRIGATEIKQESRIIGAGDFDNDGYRDVVCRIHLGKDDNLPVATWQCAVFWGNAQGVTH